MSPEKLALKAGPLRINSYDLRFGSEVCVLFTEHSLPWHTYVPLLLLLAPQLRGTNIPPSVTRLARSFLCPSPRQTFTILHDKVGPDTRERGEGIARLFWVRFGRPGGAASGGLSAQAVTGSGLRRQRGGARVRRVLAKHLRDRCHGSNSAGWIFGVHCLAQDHWELLWLNILCQSKTKTSDSTPLGTA